MHGFVVCPRAAIVALSCAAAVPAHAESCPTNGTTPVVLAHVAPRLELQLADGRLVRLAGIEAATATSATPDRGTQGAAALDRLVAGRPLAVTLLSPKPDRWGRLVAFASVPDGPVGGIAASVVAAGLARYRPEPEAASCRAALLSAEEAARRASLGLWADPSYRVLAADDRAAFAERAGTNVVVEARLRAVEPGLYRTRLRLDGSTVTPRSTSHDRLLEATIVPHAMKSFAARGVDVQSLVGRTLRLRGLLDRRFGPRIELAGPDDLEIVPEGVAPGRPN